MVADVYICNLNCAGMGKTTLANEICVKWARDGFLADEFDAIINILLRSVQKRSFEEVMIQHVGEKEYPNPKLIVADNVEKALCKMLAGIPKEAVGIVYLLCKLAYRAFFKPYSDREEKDWLGYLKWIDPKIIFTESDLTESGIQVTREFNGFGLLKATHTHQLPIDIVTYNFLHLTIQEFLCSLYMSTWSQQEQLNVLCEHFGDYPNVLMFCVA